MRKGVIVCGANGERGLVLEKVIEEFAKMNQSRIVQFSMCSVAVSPLMLTMSGLDEKKLVTINGCRNRCADRVLEKIQMKAEHSCVLDDVLERDVGPCRTTCDFSFPAPPEGEVRKFAAVCSKALE
ncbi:MAG TPA: putative zinc-binding protein [Methanomassiliicoccales archaeon]|nr:putative zinc-binding protein [Methanomassiliicoccales archaeon]